MRTLAATGDATFYPVGIARSTVAGSAFEPTPWRAVQGRRQITARG
jgi:hypothetical protein